MRGAEGTKDKSIKKKYDLSVISKNNPLGWLFAAPVIIGIFLFTFVPVVTSLYFSFTENDFFNPVVWVGLDNYERIFTTDFEIVFSSLWRTAKYTILSVPSGLILSYLLAVFLNQKIKGVGALRILYYMPCIMPAIVGSIISQDIFNVEYGIINRIFELIGLPKSEFYNNAKSAMPTLIMSGWWGCSGGMILWLAQLKAIPPHLYEAAKLDGCGPVKGFFYITVPFSTPMIFYNLVTGLIGGLQVFSNVLLLTGTVGGPDDALMFYNSYIYQVAFQRLNMGYAAALSWIMFFIVGLLTILMFKTSKWVQFAE